MSFSLLLILITSIFDIKGNFETILYLVAFAVVGYEIIWDAVSAIARKKFFNYNVVLMIAIVASLFVTSYKSEIYSTIPYRINAFLPKDMDKAMMEAGLNGRQRKEYVDMIAATFILQGYLDSGAGKTI